MSPDPNDVGNSASHTAQSQNQVERQFLRAQLFGPAVRMQAPVERPDATIASPQTQRHARSLSKRC
jgi:hypothetical protein